MLIISYCPFTLQYKDKNIIAESLEIYSFTPIIHSFINYKNMPRGKYSTASRAHSKGIKKVKRKGKKGANSKKAKIQIEKLNRLTTDSDILEMQNMIRKETIKKSKSQKGLKESLKQIKEDEKEDQVKRVEVGKQNAAVKKQLAKEMDLINSMCL